MNEINECPNCLSDELLISENQKTVICSDCGVVKKDGVWVLVTTPQSEAVI
ncbi:MULTISPECIES: TFIIB-type zinc ribbon-containing protein [Aliivibrio]|uniref:Nonsense-mediated mRNA decay protein NMD3 family protein n=1 Tax=Aliivibrio sifiae TaxID=566293 RepID=A0A2S7X3A7_9GAMM|nr:TFIIB-type zinc ribbon-containing protein [Aliivibrio sifiae]PQJ84714.1 nonsense-mediated mRNA decay protein NMD3 family protein [Aliivibrio sifiae]